MFAVYIKRGEDDEPSHTPTTMWILLLLLAAVDATSFIFTENAVIEPKNPNAVIGDQVVINCTAKDPYTSDDLYWIEPFDDVEATHVVRIDNQTLQHRRIVHDATEQEGDYLCMIRTNYTDDWWTSLAAATYLTVEYEAVRQVNRFQCHWENDFYSGDRIRCDWILREYNYLAYLSYDIKITSQRNMSTAVSCRRNFPCVGYFTPTCQPYKLEMCSCIMEELGPLFNETNLHVYLTIHNNVYGISKTWRRFVFPNRAPALVYKMEKAYNNIFR